MCITIQPKQIISAEVGRVVALVIPPPLPNVWQCSKSCWKGLGPCARVKGTLSPLDNRMFLAGNVHIGEVRGGHNGHKSDR